MEMELYFAYGSNISMEQMRRRCPSAQFVATAILGRYRLAFVRTSQRWGGGVAGIVPDADRQVEGVVYRVSGQDLDTLDGFENVAKGCYSRERIRVQLPNGAPLEVWVYKASLDPRGPFPPSRSYVQTILKGAQEHGLPAHYIAELQGMLPAVEAKEGP